MLKNLLKTAYRSISKNKFFSLIKISSLAIGLSASFVIGLMVYYDLTFDKFHPDGERIYRVTTEFSNPDGNFYNPGVTVPLAPALKENVPGLEVVSPLFLTYPLNVQNTKTDQLFKNPEFVVYADSEYFRLFDYKWLAGSGENILENPNEVVLTKNRASMYFPDKLMGDVIGSTLMYNDSVPLTVTGIVANFEQRTDIIFEEFISVETAGNLDSSDLLRDPQWGSTSSASQLFLKLEDGTNVTTIQEELDKIVKEHEDPETVAFGQKRRFYMQPLGDMHFDTNYYTFDFSTGRASKSTLISLACIALFLLLLGCINFINLNTAQATQRAKEIGVRKTLGSSKKQLVFQFLGETFILTFAAGILSLAFSFWLLRLFSDFIPSGLDFQIFSEPVVISILFILLLVVTFLSGFYPALVLSNFKAASVLKNQSLFKGDKSALRKYLTVFQFVIAQVFIIGTLLVGKQLSFLMSKDMGIRTEALASIRTPWQYQSMEKRVRLLNEIGALPGIKEISLSGNPPASNSTNTSHVTYFKNESEVHTELQFLYGDKNYLNLYDIELIAGRQQLNDTIKEMVINETYMKLLGFNNPQDVLGEVLKMSDEPYPIVGVMEDFNQRTLKAGIEPMAFAGDWGWNNRSRFNTIHFSLEANDSQNWPQTITQIEKVWDKVYADSDIEVNFMDDMVRRFYEQERRTSVLLNWATGLSIAISCLGLLGLVVYTTERRTKEIGIRKVLGASLVQLNLLLCKEFLVLVSIAFVIAAPIAWYGMDNWLQDFAYKTDISWWIFGISGIAMLLVALAIISIRTIAAANANPVKSLRTE
ncbi:ABC-type antimicrobial peptide transport system permease subunit [Saonia flava]|uniref:ABC-type antimicrobial peptide transport system permease subunit n=1 Tax=Saonia flava TaxID=523696 RepID=A0A846QQ49_9FLAO|nr:ABC transporter permease [Saonia flava]NJB70221.1 ABC-type antimicrobial peptide transport system permease subunit [Saonia flava]